MSKREAYKIRKDGKIHGQLLTHMRAVAYAPVVEMQPLCNDEEAIRKAEEKRQRKAAKRINHG